jgi:hypothetical protein
MSISNISGGTYMSDADVVAWLEAKTEPMYANLKAAMTGADTNGDAEAALNKIKEDIANSKDGTADPAAIHDEVNAALTKYKDVPGVTDLLQPIADELNKQAGTAEPLTGPGAAPPPGMVKPDTVIIAVAPAQYQAAAHAHAWGATFSAPGQPTTLTYTTTAPPTPPKITISSDQVTAWTQSIGNTVDDLGRQDQLAMINIQEFNSQINQTKQTASALMDATDKSNTDIISHIS